MKKILFSLVLALMLMIGMNSCTGCGNKAEVQTDTTEVVSKLAQATLNADHIISMDRQYMYTNHDNDYRWFESCIVLKDFLDEECDGTIVAISNIFQVVNESEDGKSADVYVVLAGHTPDTSAYEVKHAFWVEDMPLNDEAIQVSFTQAFDKLMATNCPKPHSKHVVLRKQVGPVDANPQWIFGNVQETVFVDAITGDVRTNNPCFPEEQGFKMPLGEWP